MQVRYQVWADPAAVAAGFSEVVGSLEVLHTGSATSERKMVERECPLEEFQELLRNGRVSSQSFVDVGNGWQPVDTCPLFAGLCPGAAHRSASGWIFGGLLTAAVAVAMLFWILH
jgi:hypothetical protein